MEWITGPDTTELTWEPVSVFRRDAPLLVAEYAEERKLLGMQGFQWCKQYLMRYRKRAAREVRRKRKRTLQYGVEVPSSVKHALELDTQNGNTLWQEAMDQEVAAMEEWGVFNPIEDEFKVANTHKKIILLWTFAVKVDGRRRARLVAGRNLMSLEHAH